MGAVEHDCLRQGADVAWRRERRVWSNACDQRCDGVVPVEPRARSPVVEVSHWLFDGHGVCSWPDCLMSFWVAGRGLPRPACVGAVRRLAVKHAVAALT